MMGSVKALCAVAISVIAVFSQEKKIDEIEVVLVKAGTFTMGSPASEKGRDDNEVQHKVTITKDYWISKYPITKAQYSGETGARADHPVVDVSWEDADAWAESKGGRLLTEAEWEYAARGANLSKGYIYSGSNDLNEVGWYEGNYDGGTHPVGQKKPNELGIYDMSGNVSEWCKDWYGAYPTEAVTNPTGTSTGGARVFRGGDWGNGEQGCRVASRYYGNPSYGGDGLGFRVAFPAN
ncbi:MAG: formylglycine-generating enzyme family protein [Chitinivibrionia bacterium]|nr:formylglycine-generating enzyme family protein [Chitinivibrionia bacterium]